MPGTTRSPLSPDLTPKNWLQEGGGKHGDRLILTGFASRVLEMFAVAQWTEKLCARHRRTKLAKFDFYLKQP